MNVGQPKWFHLHGRKAELDQELSNSLDRVVVIGSKAATLKIRKAEQVLPGQVGWAIHWEVVQCRSTDEIVRGRRFFSGEELSNAFGLSDGRGSERGEWLLHRFGGSSAEQGKYIREGDWLNIPCPGTGGDGDPNISIELDEVIKQAVRDLLHV